MGINSFTPSLNTMETTIVSPSWLHDKSSRDSPRCDLMCDPKTARGPGSQNRFSESWADQVDLPSITDMIYIYIYIHM